MDIINISQTFMNTREREKIGNGEAYGVFTLNKKNCQWPNMHSSVKCK